MSNALLDTPLLSYLSTGLLELEKKLLNEVAEDGDEEIVVHINNTFKS